MSEVASRTLMRQARKDTTMEKTYPFSKEKHAHDVEFFRNRLKNVMYQMESGEMQMNARLYEYYERLEPQVDDLLDAILFTGDARIARLTGKQWALAQKCVAWASEERARRNGLRGFRH